VAKLEEASVAQTAATRESRTRKVTPERCDECFSWAAAKILPDQFARQCKRRVGPGIDNVLSGATSVISAKRIAQLQAWYPRCDTSHRARTGYGNCRMNSNAMVACSALLQHLHSVLCSLYTVLPIAEFFEQWVLRPMQRISTRPTLRTVG